MPLRMIILGHRGTNCLTLERQAAHLSLTALIHQMNWLSLVTYASRLLYKISHLGLHAALREGETVCTLVLHFCSGLPRGKSERDGIKRSQMQYFEEGWAKYASFPPIAVFCV